MKNVTCRYCGLDFESAVRMAGVDPEWSGSADRAEVFCPLCGHDLPPAAPDCAECAAEDPANQAMVL